MRMRLLLATSTAFVLVASGCTFIPVNDHPKKITIEYAHPQDVSVTEDDLPPISGKTSGTTVENLNGTQVASLPSSSAKPKHRWTSIGKYPFKGDFKAACSVLELTADECGRYQKMVHDGACTTMKIENGTVHGYLGFTSAAGVNKAIRDVLVDLQTKGASNTPITEGDRMALVCDLGDKVVGKYLYCNNPSRDDKRPNTACSNPPAAVKPCT